MARLRIRGGGALNGTIDVRGAKNAATPMLAAALLTSDPVVLKNVPRIDDFFAMADIAASVGTDIQWIGEHALRVHAHTVDPVHLDTTIVKRLRSSVLFLGALLGRAGWVRIPQPGGCKIGARPITTHLHAFETLGAHVEERDEEIYIELSTTDMDERTVVLREMSVTGTENTLLLAATLSGTTRIYGAAAEPHVQAVARMLQRMGARIDGIGTHILTVHGGTLEGTTAQVEPDPIEAGTFLILGALARGSLAVSGVSAEQLARFLVYLEDCGVHMKTVSRNDDGTLVVRVEHSSLEAVSFETRVWPGIPTDLQAPLCVLATQARGTTQIHETLFEGRFQHLRELERMGANAIIRDPHHAVVTGPTPLYAQEIRSFDLRAGATLIIAALIAQGESIIHDVEQVDRGYERIAARLRSLGADIERITAS